MKAKPLRKFLKEENMLETVEESVLRIQMKYCPNSDIWAYLKQVTVKPSRATTRLGSASYGSKVLRVTVLDISPEKRRDTILHEIAHFVTAYIFNLRVAPHGREWKQIAKMMGAKPQASSKDPRFQAAANSLLESRDKIVARCSKCDFEVLRARTTERFHTRVYRHRDCGGIFEPPDKPGYWKEVM